LNLNHISDILRINKMRISYLFIFLAIFYCSDSYSQVKNEDDLKKQAEKYFEDEDYNLAYKLFAQLVSLYPKDPDYNYKLGVCMLYTEPDKKKPYSYLQLATKNPADAPKDAKFYLAKTYHVNYRFDEAIKLYTEYKAIGSAHLSRNFK
jgi:tetratricopeptide (TPR) repeat protein